MTTRLRRAGLILGRAVGAWALGVVGTVGAINGYGDLVVYGPVQAQGLRWILGLTAAWSIVAWLRREHLVELVAGAVGLTGALLVVTRQNVGRSVGATAAIGVVVAFGLVAMPLPRRWSGRARPPVAVAPLVVLAIAQFEWASRSRPVPTLVLTAVAAALGVGYLLRPAQAQRAHDLVAAPFVRAARVFRRRSAVVCADGRRRLASIGSAPDAVAIGAAALVTVALSAPIYYRYSTLPPEVVGSSDFATHLGRVEVTTLVPFAPGTPYPLYHVSTHLLEGLFGLGWASTLVLCGATVLTTLALVWLCRLAFAGRPGTDAWMGAVVAVAYFVSESPNVVAQALRVGNSFDWAPTLHMYLNPTDTMVVPFGLVSVILLSRAISSPTVPSRRDGLLLLAATILTPLAKPSLTIPLIVGVPTVLLLTRRLTPALLRYLAWTFVAPTLLVFVWQTWFLSEGDNGINRSGFSIEWFHTVRMAQLDRSGPLLLAGLLVVPLCLWAAPRRYLAEPAVRLALVMLLVSIPVMLLFRESGARGRDATFTKPAFISSVLLQLLSWRFLLGEMVASRSGGGRRWRPWQLVAAAFGALCVVAGVISLCDSYGWIHLPVRGSA